MPDNFLSVCSIRRCFCSVTYWFTAIQTLGLVAAYFIFSIGLTFYQKWFIKDFHFPLFVVLCHLVIKFFLAGLCRLILEWCTKNERVLLNWKTNVKKLSAIGVTSALDIGLSNWSFEFISISLYTMSKSSCIIFILIFSFLFGLEKMKYSLIAVVTLIASGLFLFTFHSTQFNMEGFAMVMAASVTGGLRWTLSQLVMHRKELGLSNPIDMIYHVQPWMILGLLPLALFLEGSELAPSSKILKTENVTVSIRIASLIVGGSLIAFCMEVTEFMLLYFTSSLTLSIAGIFKEVFMMTLAWFINGDSIGGALNIAGLVLSLMGIVLHVVLKSVPSGEQSEKKSTEIPLLNEDNTFNEDEEDILFHAQKTR